jgi:hypothetical protein
MTWAEYIYRMLLWLYPTKHRKAYRGLMLQHARDLGRVAQQQGRWHVVLLCLRLLKDGIINASIEHLEAIMMTKNRFKPVPWLSVFLASLPGFLMALSRCYATLLDPLLSTLWYFYLGLLVLAPPIIWWQRRRFPVWALLPVGMLVWFLTFRAGTELSGWLNSLRIPDLNWIRPQTGIAVTNIVLAAVLFAALLRGQRVPGSIWLIVGVIVFGNVLLATLYSLAEYDGAWLFHGMLQYFTSSGIGPIEGLMLIAVGLFAARRHGVLALLVVIGGYGYMLMDSDYLFGYPFRDWTGLPTYLTAITILYLVAAPIALLRAKTRLWRAFALFVPMVAFHIIRLIVPLLVIQQPIKMRPGDVIFSINIVLILICAWLLYSHLGETTPDTQPDSNLQASPSTS